MDWYTAARTIDQNRATNEAFQSSYQTPSVAPTPSHPATFNTVRFQAPERSTNHQHALTPGNPVPMDIDASRKMQPLPFSCYRCGKAGHKAPDCPTRFSIDMQNPVSENPTVIPTEIIWNRRPKWEQRLPSKLVIASAEDSSTSLKLKVKLETTDTGEVESVNSFVDSGATGEFIDRHYAKSNWLHTQKLSEPIPVYNVDGTLNKAGSITEVKDLILRYRNHSERTLFTVTGLELIG